MQTEIIWKTTLKNGIYGSLTSPLADPFNPDHFYVADGWGSIVISGGEKPYRSDRARGNDFQNRRRPNILL